MSDYSHAAQTFGAVRSVQHDGVVTLYNTLDTITIEVDHITERGAVLRFTTRSSHSACCAKVTWRVVRSENPYVINCYPSRKGARSILASTVAIYRTMS